jgi:hypothetical protein
MTDKQTGGPAFPCDLTMYDEEVKVNYQGMTLRDYFAAKALPAVIADPDTRETLHIVIQTRGECTFQLTAALLAYGFADAMLKARNE